MCLTEFNTLNPTEHKYLVLDIQKSKNQNIVSNLPQREKVRVIQTKFFVDLVLSDRKTATFQEKENHNYCTKNTVHVQIINMQELAPQIRSG